MNFQLSAYCKVKITDTQSDPKIQKSQIKVSIPYDHRGL